VAAHPHYQLADRAVAALTELDHAAVASCQDDDEEAFHEAFTRLLEFVRTSGRPVDADHLGGSDLILPPLGVSLKEARSEFQREGLVPG